MENVTTWKFEVKKSEKNNLIKSENVLNLMRFDENKNNGSSKSIIFFAVNEVLKAKIAVVRASLNSYKINNQWE